jgi:uncharacterized repeat protein (TIGR01451 family)
VTPPTGPPFTPPPDTTVTPTAQVSAIELVKTADRIKLVAGQTITYSFTATNTGNTTLSKVFIAESAFTGSGTAPVVGGCTPVAPATLAPGDDLDCIATYVVSQADVDAGQVDNTATATGTPPTGPDVTDTDDAQVPAVQTRRATLDKIATSTDVDGDGLIGVDDVIDYKFVVTNTGNVTLTNVTVNDSLLAGVPITVTCPAGPLAPGLSVTCVADAPYVVSQADVDAGAVDNSATATVTPPTGPPFTPPPDTTVTPTAQVSAIELVKTADRTKLVAGQTITYSFTATNTGNTTLSKVFIAESAFTGSGTAPVVGGCTPVAPATLAPGDDLDCIATYVVSQADVDAGQVDNTATATGTPPTGPDVTDTDDAQVPAVRAPAIELVKTADRTKLVAGNGITDAGDEIDYEFEVTNTGGATLTNVTVNDPLVGLVVCNPTTLAPNESVVCEAHASYVITQADADSGVVENIATATGTTPDGTDVDSDPDHTSTPITRRAGATLDKRVASVTDVNGNGRTDVGDTILYEFEVTNTGTVTLTNVEVNDPKLARNGITVTCDPSTLAPGESVVCTADSQYVVTKADVKRGSVHNVATVDVDVPPGVEDPEPPTDTHEYPTNPSHVPNPSPPSVDLPNTGAPQGASLMAAGGVLLPLLGLLVLLSGRSGTRTPTRDRRRRR